MSDLRDDRGMVRNESHLVVVFSNETDFAELVEVVLDFLADCARNGIAAGFVEELENALGGTSRGRGVPERNGRNSINVDMLRALFELGKFHEAIADILEIGMVHLKEYCPITLNNEWLSVGVIYHSLFRRHSSSKSRSNVLQGYIQITRCRWANRRCRLPERRFPGSRPRPTQLLPRRESPT